MITGPQAVSDPRAAPASLAGLLSAFLLTALFTELCGACGLREATREGRNLL